jgi:hypothetical protein
MLSSTVLQLAFSTCKATSTRHPPVRVTMTEPKRTPPLPPASDTEEAGSTFPHCVRLRLPLVGCRVAGCAGGSVPLVCACTRAKKLLKPAESFSSSLSCVGVACAARHHCECGGLGRRRYGGGGGYPASGAWLLRPCHHPGVDRWLCSSLPLATHVTVQLPSGCPNLAGSSWLLVVVGSTASQSWARWGALAHWGVLAHWPFQCHV